MCFLCGGSCLHFQSSCVTSWLSRHLFNCPDVVRCLLVFYWTDAQWWPSCSKLLLRCFYVVNVFFQSRQQVVARVSAVVVGAFTGGC